VASADRPRTTPPPPLACGVRGCGQPLVRTDAHYACASRHAFDIARSGYVNLLQPQDRRSRGPGDTAAAVAARSRLLAAGVGSGTITAIARLIAALDTEPAATIVDLGCGGGELLGTLAPPVTAIGIDLSAPAVDAAARRYPALTWVVANADRRLPVLDAAADAIVSLNGRRNPAEAARVLRPHGTLIVGLPAADDLIELRAQALGEGVERDRVAGAIAEHAALFTVRDRVTIRDRHVLDRAALLDLLTGTYRGRRTSHADRLATLDRLTVTAATEILVFARGS
jgi:23S rRNA (guanine745-N1)-methyltransferase